MGTVPLTVCQLGAAAALVLISGTQAHYRTVSPRCNTPECLDELGRGASSHPDCEPIFDGDGIGIGMHPSLNTLCGLSRFAQEVRSGQV